MFISFFNLFHNFYNKDDNNFIRKTFSRNVKTYLFTYFIIASRGRDIEMHPILLLWIILFPNLS
jgi:hypothetical protein